jgi:4-carboxymuconolactone decarboxylase
MKASKNLVMLLTIAAIAFVSGYGFRSAFAQQNMAADQSAEKLPADVDPVTRNRMPPVSKDEFTIDEDKQEYDHLVGLEPRFGKPQTGGTGIRLHMPVVADAFRTDLGYLREKSGLDPKYQELAVMVSSRESNNEYEWTLHEAAAVKLNSRDIVELIRNNQEPKGLGEKEETIIRFGREMHRGLIVSPKTFADMQRLIGQRGTLTVTMIMVYYEGNGLLFRAYDQKVDPGKTRPFPDRVAMETGKK